VLICAPLVNRGSNALCVASATRKTPQGELVNQFITLTNQLAAAMEVGAVLLLQ